MDIHVAEKFDAQTTNTTAVARKLQSVTGTVATQWQQHVTNAAKLILHQDGDHDSADAATTLSAPPGISTTPMSSHTLKTVLEGHQHNGGESTSLEKQQQEHHHEAQLRCAMEFIRLHHMRALSNVVFDLCMEAGQNACKTGSSSSFVSRGNHRGGRGARGGRGGGNQPPPSFDEHQRVVKKCAIEMIPHWILHTLNDEEYQVLFQDVFVSVDDAPHRKKYVCNKIMVGVPELIGKKIVRRSAKNCDSNNGKDDDEGILVSVDNRYEGTMKSTSTAAKKIELSDYRIANEDDCLGGFYPDELLPVGEIELRGSNVAVFQRSLQICLSDKKKALKLAADVTDAATKARRSIAQEYGTVAQAGAREEGHPVVDVAITYGENSESATENDVDVVLPEKFQKTEVETDDASSAAMATSDGNAAHITVTLRTHGNDGGSGDTRRHNQSINAAHLKKLQALHHVQNQGDNLFPLHVASLLMRYAAFVGPQEAEASGFHSSIHPKCAAALARPLFPSSSPSSSTSGGFGVIAEGFAMPMNTNAPYFCSLFPETDAPFGSMGNFFSLKPQRGSFHVNPPFDSIVMSRLCRHLMTLLETSDDRNNTRQGGSDGDGGEDPLVFFIVMPHQWDESKVKGSVDALLQSKYCVASTSVAQDKCVYTGGNQHRLVRPYFRIKWDTGITVVANMAAQKKATLTLQGGSGLWERAVQTVLGEWAEAVDDVNDRAL